MVLPGHLAGGYIMARLLLSVSHPSLSAEQIGALTVVGALAGELPDIDLVRAYFQKTDHHQYFTHAPFFWLMISLGIVGGGFIFGSLFTEYVGWMILAGTWTHLLLDLSWILDPTEYGVMWLWPFTNKRFMFRKTSEEMKMKSGSINTKEYATIPYYWKFLTQEYCKYWTCYVEILITLVAIYLLFH
jgi:hypothetical protein